MSDSHCFGWIWEAGTSLSFLQQLYSPSLGSGQSQRPPGCSPLILGGILRLAPRCVGEACVLLSRLLCSVAWPKQNLLYPNDPRSPPRTFPSHGAALDYPNDWENRLLEKHFQVVSNGANTILGHKKGNETCFLLPNSYAEVRKGTITRRSALPFVWFSIFLRCFSQC